MTTTLWVPWRESGVYLDTSALIKRYVAEDGSELVDEIMAPEGPRIFVSWVTVVETVSNLRRMEVVDKRLSAQETNDAIRLLLTEMNLGQVFSCQVGPRTTERARELLRRKYLGPADSIHLATAIRLQEQHGWLPLVFTSADDKLIRAAQDEFLYVFNPLDPVVPPIRGVHSKFLPTMPTVGYSDA